MWSVKFVGEDRVLTGQSPDIRTRTCGKADAVASADNKIKLHSIDIQNGKSTVMQKYTGHTQPVRGLSLKPDGKGFWSCANDGCATSYLFVCESATNDLDL